MSCRSVTRHLLQEYYDVSINSIPEKRVKSEWTRENRCGFFLGIVAYGMDIHKDQLNALLTTKQFTNCEMAFLDSMFAIYIRPFHTWYTSSSCSRAPVRPRDDYRECEEREEEYELFETAVARRDGEICLLCWRSCCLVPTLILNIPREGSPQAGPQRSSMHYVQNALYLCVHCHAQFGRLRWYIDNPADIKLVFKQVHDLPRSRLGLEVVGLRYSALRCGKIGQAVENNGEIALYFEDNARDRLPNKKVLEQHKTACLIWRMAGGTENDMDEYCCIDDD